MLIQWVLNLNLLWEGTWSRNVLTTFVKHLVQHCWHFLQNTEGHTEMNLIWQQCADDVHAFNSIWQISGAKRRFQQREKSLHIPIPHFFENCIFRLHICSMICPLQGADLNSGRWWHRGYIAEKAKRVRDLSCRPNRAVPLSVQRTHVSPVPGTVVIAPGGADKVSPQCPPASLSRAKDAQNPNQDHAAPAQLPASAIHPCKKNKCIATTSLWSYKYPFNSFNFLFLLLKC